MGLDVNMLTHPTWGGGGGGAAPLLQTQKRKDGIGNELFLARVMIA